VSNDLSGRQGLGERRRFWLDVLARDHVDPRRLRVLSKKRVCVKDCGDLIGRMVS
jgi:hypothetical protein